MNVCTTLVTFSIPSTDVFPPSFVVTRIAPDPDWNMIDGVQRLIHIRVTEGFIAKDAPVTAEMFLTEAEWSNIRSVVANAR